MLTDAEVLLERLRAEAVIPVAVRSKGPVRKDVKSPIW